MKITLPAILLAAALFALPAPSQTIGSSVPPQIATSGFFKVMAFLSTNAELLDTNRNWTLVPYLSRAKGLLDAQGKEAGWGGGAALLYPLSDYVKTGFRLQYFAGELFMPSVNVQLSSSYHVAGTRAVWTPVVFTGIASPVGGSSDNGAIGTLYGAGLSVKYPVSDRWTAGVGYALETWSNLRVDRVEHFALVLDYKF